MDKNFDDFIKGTIRIAGTAVLERFRKVSVSYTKSSPSDVVTEADLVSNKLITDAIKREYPEHGIISEEEPEVIKDSEYVWIVDPLDGTRNFATKTPLFAVMMALAKNGTVEYGAIFDPVHDELFFAKRGGGAFLNGQKISCSETKEWDHSFGCANANMSLKKVPYFSNLIRVSRERPFWLSSFGSVAISSVFVADGRRDWYCSQGAKIWDYAPATLIMSEAGCKVTNFNGDSWTLKDDSLVAANKYLHSELLKIAKESSV